MSCTVWDSLELSGTVWDSLGLSGTLLTQLGHTQIELLDGWDLKIRGRLSENFETLLLLEHLAVLIIISRFPFLKRVEIVKEINLFECLGISWSVWDPLGLSGTSWDWVGLSRTIGFSGNT